MDFGAAGSIKACAKYFRSNESKFPLNLSPDRFPRLHEVLLFASNYTHVPAATSASPATTAPCSFSPGEAWARGGAPWGGVGAEGERLVGRRGRGGGEGGGQSRGRGVGAGRGGVKWSGRVRLVPGRVPRDQAPRPVPCFPLPSPRVPPGPWQCQRHHWRGRGDAPKGPLPHQVQDPLYLGLLRSAGECKVRGCNRRGLRLQVGLQAWSQTRAKTLAGPVQDCGPRCPCVRPLAGPAGPPA